MMVMIVMMVMMGRMVMMVMMTRMVMMVIIFAKLMFSRQHPKKWIFPMQNFFQEVSMVYFLTV